MQPLSAREHMSWPEIKPESELTVLMIKCLVVEFARLLHSCPLFCNVDTCL